MSTVEQWSAFCEHQQFADPGMETREATHKGFDLKATASPMNLGFAMRIFITPRHTEAIQQAVQIPPWPPERYASADEALNALIAYGHALIDGTADSQF